MNAEVEGKAVDTWLVESLEAVGTVPKIRGLKLADLKSKHLAAQQAITTYVGTLDDLEFPLEFDEHRDKFVKLAGAYSSAWKAILRVKASVSETASESSQNESKQKIDWRSCREKYRGYFIKRGVPPAMAKVMADLLYSIGKPPKDVGINIEYQSPLCSIQDGSDAAAMRQPFMVKFSSNEDHTQKGHFENILGQLYLENKTAAVNNMRECLQIMRAPTASMNCTFGSIANTSALELNPAWLKNETWFDPVTGLRQAVWASNTECCDISVEAWPWTGPPCVLTMYVGRAVVTVVPSEVVAGLGLEPQEWLDGLSSEAMRDYYSFFVEEGSSVWIPMCMVPVICGIGPLIDAKSAVADLTALKGKDLQRHQIAVGVHPVFCSKYLVKHYTAAEVSKMLSIYGHGEAHTLNTWKGEGVSKWKAELDDWITKTVGAKTRAE